MTNTSIRSLFSVSILSLFYSQASANVGCDIGTWNYWCGVDTFLSQQEPSASGVAGAPSQGFKSITFDAESFGGNLLQQNDSPESTNEWVAYAFNSLLSNTVRGVEKVLDSDVKEITVKVNLDNELISIEGVFDNGKTVSFNATELESYSINFKDGLQKQFGLPGSASGGNVWVDDNGDNTSVKPDYFTGQFNQGYDCFNENGGCANPTNTITSGFLGKISSLDDIKSEMNKRAQVFYSLKSFGSYGEKYDGIINGNMTVDFSGSGSWKATNIHSLVDAEGTISGNTFKSTSVSVSPDGLNQDAVRIVNDNSFTSGVSGHFIGNKGKGVIGKVKAKVVTGYKDNGSGIVETGVKDLNVVFEGEEKFRVYKADAPQGDVF